MVLSAAGPGLRRILVTRLHAYRFLSSYCCIVILVDDNCLHVCAFSPYNTQRTDVCNLKQKAKRDAGHSASCSVAPVQLERSGFVRDIESISPTHYVKPQDTLRAAVASSLL